MKKKKYFWFLESIQQQVIHLQQNQTSNNNVYDKELNSYKGFYYKHVRALMKKSTRALENYSLLIIMEIKLTKILRAMCMRFPAHSGLKITHFEGKKLFFQTFSYVTVQNLRKISTEKYFEKRLWAQTKESLQKMFTGVTIVYLSCIIIMKNFQCEFREKGIWGFKPTLG